MIRDHNDYEIIHRVKEGDQDAFELLVSNYSRFIGKQIHRFNLEYDYDDLYQESLILLYKLALRFKESYNKSFTRLFELSLKRMLISAIEIKKRRKNKTVHYKRCIAQRNHRVGENSVYFTLHLDEVRKVLTPTEFTVYTLREIKNLSIQSICEETNLSVKKTYNALHRSKVKIRQHFATE